MVQSRHWLLVLRLELPGLWELTSLILPPGLAHTLGHAQLYCSSKVVSRVVVWVAAIYVFQPALLILNEMADGKGLRSHLLQLLIGNQLT